MTSFEELLVSYLRSYLFNKNDGKKGLKLLFTYWQNEITVLEEREKL